MYQIPASSKALRYVLIACLLALPLLSPGALFVVACVAVTVTAYEGVRATVVYGMLALLVAVELLYGTDIGVVSLSYLLSVVCLMVSQRFVTMTPWSHKEGWHGSDAFRAWCVAYVLLAITMLGGVLIGNELYGSSLLRARFQNTVAELLSPGTAVWIAAVLLIVRRTAVPFRRHILFGT